MTVYDVCMRHNYSSAWVKLGEGSSACTQSGGEHAVTEKYRCRCCGRIIADSRERRLLRSDANTEARELLTELLATAYSGKKNTRRSAGLAGRRIKNSQLHLQKSVLCFTPESPEGKRKT